jgi:phosphatidylglycerol:prolipoprotein diacylglycerol transferase
MPFLPALFAAFAGAPSDVPLPPEAAKYWVYDLDPFVVHFPAGWFLPGIRWYGLAYIAGFIIATWLLWLYAKKGRFPLDAEARSTLMTFLILGVLIGGRLGYCLLYRPDELLHNPLYFFRVWEGGMASHGGFIGGLLAVWWFGRISKLGFLRVSDAVVTLVPAGLFLGRLANFVNGELWGKAATVPWAMIFPIKEGGVIVDYTRPVHPSQLYEAALEGLLLLALVQWRWWSSPPPGSPGSRPSGQLAGEFFIAYAIVRIICEIFREPDAGISLIFGLSRGTFYSIFMILGGLAFILASRRFQERASVEARP